MENDSLSNLFDGYVNNNHIFKNKDTLTTKFTPDDIPHREKNIKDIALMLAPVLRNEKPSNIFIYGKTGTGKTLVIKKILENLITASEKNNIKLKIIYINCKMHKVTDTEYRLLAQLIHEFGEDVPYTGLPTNELYKKLFVYMGDFSSSVVVVLDEIDSLINKIGDEVLYNLTRINQDLNKTNLTIIGISNNLSFIETLDPRVRSSLSEEESIFYPYDAIQLKDILTTRSKGAFVDGVVGGGVVAKCAALAAQEHGDARKALDLLRVSGEIAERNGKETVMEEHVDMAQKKLDTDRFMEIMRTQPRQSQIVFKSMIDMHAKDDGTIETGMVYNVYSNLCKNSGIKPLTQRRVSDLISEFETFGMINTSVTSKGRYGRTRVINISLSDDLINKISNHLTKELC